MHAINVRGMPANASGILYAGRSCAGWQQSPLGNPHRGPDREQNIAFFKRDLWAAIQAGLRGAPHDNLAAGGLERSARPGRPHSRPGRTWPWAAGANRSRCHTDVICAAVAWLGKQNVPPRCAAGRDWAKKEIGSSPEGGFGARHEPISEVEF